MLENTMPGLTAATEAIGGAAERRHQLGERAVEHIGKQRTFEVFQSRPIKFRSRPYVGSQNTVRCSAWAARNTCTALV